MDSAIDPATEAFLESIRRDLQRRLAVSGRVDAVDAGSSPTGALLRAWISVADERLELAGTGDTLIDAYADLLRRTPVRVLESAYRQVLDSTAE